jgi:hypothetical protein
VPDCVDVMLAIAPRVGQDVGYTLPELVLWLCQAPPGVSRLVVQDGYANQARLQWSAKCVHGHDILTSFTKTRKVGVASRDLVGDLLAYVRRS